MTTSIEKDELGAELQELYLRSKQWLSELDFQNDEMMFLKGLLGINCHVLIIGHEIDTVAERFIDAAKMEEKQSCLRTQIGDFMHLLGSLLKTVDPVIDYKLMLLYNKLESDIYINAEKFQLFKNRVLYTTAAPAAELSTVK
ncbi:hypothetical protein [Daejeonella sp.]|uniref:hypothetical protein n=1 Tax=Daejeonella sp. TaxID=2805397 RepID=UPI0039839AAE